MQNLNKATATPENSSLSPSPTNGASVRTGLQIAPSPTEAANALQSSALQIGRLQSNAEQPTARAAAAAYKTQAGALTRLNEQTQSGGSPKINMMA